MALQARIAGEMQDEQVAESDESNPAESPGPTPGTGPSPFVLDYDFSEWETDAESADQAIGLLIAFSNLL